jgi:serine/threonine protein kinase
LELDFTGTARFQPLRCLGAGGAGVVFEALDREQGTRVALKVLATLSAENLIRFKNEFRAMQDLQHPNLVVLGELIEERGNWFFTMEFIDGVDLLTWVRGAVEQVDDERPTVVTRPPPSSADRDKNPVTADQPRPSARSGDERQPRYDEARLRSAFIQLARGLEALHAAGKVHRDIKPSNVLVTPGGRVVILDFGLVMDVEQQDHITQVDHIVGTADYMAPEQASAANLGPEVDWYSMGVVLFQALTGRLPFLGSRLDVLMDKQAHDAAPPSAILPSIPDDLDALCHALLRRLPADRPSGAEVVHRLAPGGSPATQRADEVPPVETASAARQQTATLFVGRAAEQVELLRAFDRTRMGAAVTVCLCGESGVGKTALARRLAERLVAERGAVLLAGRCYERESVPYKAIDGVVDALGRYMMGLAKSEANALLPLRAALLPQIFPVLRRVDAIANAPLPLTELADPQELRGQVFAALRELLIRLTDRRPLVVLIDDLQWTDSDSLALLRELLRPPDPPALLLLATLRIATEMVAMPVATLHGPGARADSRPDRTVFDAVAALPGEVRRLEVGRLPDRDARALAAALVGDGAGAAVDAEAIAGEAKGHPLFIDELVRHANAGHVHTRGRLALEDALWTRIGQLPSQARSILELVAVAGAPLAEEMAAQAAAMEFAEFSRQLAALRTANLIRTTGARRTDQIEPYHDRVRVAVMAHLDDEVRRSWHGRLALALETSGEAEALALHWRGAGRPDRAAQHALEAAAGAVGTLAFDRAAGLYRLALELGLPAGCERSEVQARLGDALANAGRGAEAARIYLEAASAWPARALDLRRRAGNQLMLSGRIDEGLAVLHEVLAQLGLRLARTPRRAIPALLFRRAQIRLRGLAFRDRAEHEVPPALLQLVDLCYSMTAGLYVDPVRGAHFQSRHLLLALKAGEPFRVARALTGEVAYSAAAGSRSDVRTTRLLEMNRRLAERTTNPYAQAMYQLGAGFAHYLQGRWRACREACDQAERSFLARCTGVAWELAGSRIFLMRSLFFQGEMREMSRRLPQLRHEARELGSLYAASQFSSGSLVLDVLARDDVRGAHEMAQRAATEWLQRGVHVNHYTDLLGRSYIDLYGGEVDRAIKGVVEKWPVFSNAMLLRVQLIRVQSHDLRARAALAAACADATARERWLTDVESSARKLDRERIPWAQALGALARAGAAAARGQDERAVGLFEDAITRCRAADMRLHAAIAERRKGQVMAGTGGAQLVASADRWMADEGVVSPARMAFTFAPCR